MEKWQETDEFGTRLLKQFEGVLVHVLYHLNIPITHASYDDYLQEGRLIILGTYQKKRGNPFEAPDKCYYAGYIKRGFRWYMLSTLSKENRSIHRDSRYLQERKQVETPLDSVTEQLSIGLYLQKLQPPLTTREHQLITCLIRGERPKDIIHRYYNKNDSAYYWDISKIKKRLLKSQKKSNKTIDLF